jgi:hypothetical protein
MSNAAERHARRQLLLTRIAFQRHELRSDVELLRHSLEPRQLLRAVVGDSFGGAVGRLFRGRAMPTGDLLSQALGWLRRYRMAAALVGGAAPLLRGGGRWRRWLRVAAIAGASWLGWRTIKDRQRRP